MGGKAIDAAWILGKLRAPVKAMGFVAGANGVRMQAMLQKHEVATDFEWVQGETRQNIVLVCADGSGQSTVTPSSLQVFPEQVESLLIRYQAALVSSCCVVAGGSVPAGIDSNFFSQTIHLANQKKIPVLFDSAGAALQNRLEARPAVIKPNLHERSGLIGYRPVSLVEACHAVWAIRQSYGCEVVLTLGAEGAVALAGEQWYWIPPVNVPVRSAAGAGDGVLAGLALALSKGENFRQGLCYGFALAGAILQTLGTADFRLQDYQDLLSENRVREIDLDRLPSLLL